MDFYSHHRGCCPAGFGRDSELAQPSHDEYQAWLETHKNYFHIEYNTFINICVV